MSIAQLDSLYAEAVAALDAGDYDTAIAKALALKVRLAATPNLSRSLAGGGQQSLAWGGAQGLDQFIAEVRKLKAQMLAERSGGIQQTKIIYARPVDSGDSA
jgi:hypothetical protein